MRKGQGWDPPGSVLPAVEAKSLHRVPARCSGLLLFPLCTELCLSKPLQPLLPFIGDPEAAGRLDWTGPGGVWGAGPGRAVPGAPSAQGAGLLPPQQGGPDRQAARRGLRLQEPHLCKKAERWEEEQKQAGGGREEDLLSARPLEGQACGSGGSFCPLAISSRCYFKRKS